MKTSPTLSELEHQRKAGLDALPLWHQRAALRDHTEDLAETELTLPLLSSLPLSPDEADQETGVAQFLTWLCEQAPEARREMLESDIHLLSSAPAMRHEMLANRPFGFYEAAFPIIEDHQVVGVLWSGKFRRDPLSEQECENMASQFNLDPEDIASRARLISPFSPGMEHRYLDVYRRLKESTEAALATRKRMHALASELLDTERTRSLGTLSSGVAHHFNNLLSVILGYSSFLLNRLELPEDATQALRQISDAAQKGRRLTEELLAFAGSEVEEDTLCSVHNIMTSVLSLLQTQTSGRITVETHLDAAKDQVLAPRSMIHQVMFNLLINAMDSMPNGGELSIKTSNIEDEDRAESIRIEVRDSGDIDQVSRASRLSSLMGMVGQLEGEARKPTANSSEVTLPLHRNAPTPPPARAVKKRLAPSLIWVVDDDPIFCEMCERVLTDEGHTVSAIPSGSDMMQQWEKGGQHPNLLILDFSMPEYSGLELCTWLRDQGSRAPIILVSGLAPTQPDIHKALQMRKTFFLQKPFPVPELADIVTVALGETLLGE